MHEHYEEVEHYFRNMAAVNGKPFDTTCQNYLKAIFNQSEREVDIDEHHHQVCIALVDPSRVLSLVSVGLLIANYQFISFNNC